MDEPRKFRKFLIQDVSIHNKNGLTKVSHSGTKRPPVAKPTEKPAAEVKQPEVKKVAGKPRKLMGKY